MTDESITKAIYQQIAIDIVSRIARGEFSPGDKIHGRSTLASEYKVSPETIRRSVTLLENEGIVDVIQGSGIMVRSRDSAFKFIEKYKVMDSVVSIKNDINKLIEKRKEIDSDMDASINKIINFSDRFKNTNSFSPFEVTITRDSKILGKTIAETKFWQQTGATIVGIRRKDELILSPGSCESFLPGDTFILIGDEASCEKVVILLNK